MIHVLLCLYTSILRWKDCTIDIALHNLCGGPHSHKGVPIFFVKMGTRDPHFHGRGTMCSPNTLKMKKGVRMALAEKVMKQGREM